MFYKRFLSILCIGASFFLGLLYGNAQCNAEMHHEVKKGLEEGWIWTIAVLPPEEGWQSEEGQSISLALSVLEQEINESAAGIAGYDVFFELEDIPSEEELEVRQKAWQKNNVAVLSFVRGSLNNNLVSLLGEKGPVLLSAYGENLSLRNEKGSILPYVFALDLPETYRAEALAAYGSHIFKTDNGVAQITDRLDDGLSARSDRFSTLAAKHGWPVYNFWKSGAGDNSFKTIYQEGIQSGANCFILWLDSLAMTNIYQSQREYGLSLSLWYGGEPNPALRNCEGIIAVSQEYSLESDLSLAAFERKIWTITRKNVPDRALAGRAWSAASWLLQGLHRAKTPDPDIVATLMPAIEGVSLGKKVLKFSDQTHRPEEREVSILQVKKGRFEPIATVNVRGGEE